MLSISKPLSMYSRSQNRRSSRTPCHPRDQPDEDARCKAQGLVSWRMSGSLQCQLVQKASEAHVAPVVSPHSLI